MSDSKLEWEKEFVKDCIVPYWKYRCPVCRTERQQASLNFCAVCGADLRTEEGGIENG